MFGNKVLIFTGWLQRLYAGVVAEAIPWIGCRGSMLGWLQTLYVGSVAESIGSIGFRGYMLGWLQRLYVGLVSEVICWVGCGGYMLGWLRRLCVGGWWIRRIIMPTSSHNPFGFFPQVRVWQYHMISYFSDKVLYIKIASLFPIFLIS